MSGVGPQADSHGPRHAHAPETASIRGLFITMVALVVVLGIVFVIVHWMLGDLQNIRPGIPPYSAAVGAKPPAMAAGWVTPPEDAGGTAPA